MKILLCDDDPMVRDALKTIIEASGEQVIGMAEDGREAVSLFGSLRPDLLLMDIRMKKMNGLEASREILALYPDAKILLLTTFKDEEYISEALALGCRGYLLKQNFAAIIPSIKAAVAGNLVFDSDVVGRLASAPQFKPDNRLSEQEQRLWMLVAEGYNNKEIAAQMHLSEGTVRNYLSSILEILDLRDRTQLAVAYYKRMLGNSKS